MAQSGSDYGPYLANEASPLHTTTIVERCTEKLVDDWHRMRANVSFVSLTATHVTLLMLQTISTVDVADSCCLVCLPCTT